jgi:protoporphyrinogen oxidase
MKQGKAIIIGAGPAGLTAAIELQRSTGIKPIVIEASQEIGGISRTVVYKHNRMDIGGHRFFSKSDRVMRWWLELMPMATSATHAQAEDLVMLERRRKSRIYFMRRFFDYPIRLNGDTLKKMGLLRTFRAGISYIHSAVSPRGEEKSLEDFLIHRFGKQLYLTFFKSYTEKVWGVPCHQISAAWGAQRIKGLSLKNVAVHFLRKVLGADQAEGLAQKQTETSLIDRFLYPKLGPGQLWEHAADLIRKDGGEIQMGVRVDRVNVADNRVVSLEGINSAGQHIHYDGDYFFSAMSIRDLIRAFSVPVPSEVAEVSEGLMYRDFITVGLLVDKLAVTENDGTLLKDNWIYVQEPDVQLGRLQIFNNWSPWLVGSNPKVWIGLEYFCNETDSLWKLSDDAMIQLAVEEVAKIGILSPEKVEDAHVVRVPKAYPAYFGSFERFDVVRRYADSFENLFLVGRNGMHRYNNQDHSMLTAMTSVENIVNDVTTKDNIWAINTENEYHEDEGSESQQNALNHA